MATGKNGVRKAPEFSFGWLLSLSFFVVIQSWSSYLHISFSTCSTIFLFFWQVNKLCHLSLCQNWVAPGSCNSCQWNAKLFLLILLICHIIITCFSLSLFFPKPSHIPFLSLFQIYGLFTRWSALKICISATLHRLSRLYLWNFTPCSLTIIHKTSGSNSDTSLSWYCRYTWELKGRNTSVIFFIQTHRYSV